MTQEVVLRHPTRAALDHVAVGRRLGVRLGEDPLKIGCARQPPIEVCLGDPVAMLAGEYPPAVLSPPFVWTKAAEEILTKPNRPITSNPRN